MYISRETSDQTHERLLRVIASARLRIYDEPYCFIETPRSKERLMPHPQAVALVGDEEVWSQLVPATPESSEPFRLFRFHFVEGQDNSGFVGWLASYLKQRVGTGVFIICGQNTARSGIFDYWGCPLDVADEVLSAVNALRDEGVARLKASAQLITYDPRYREAFATLNRIWIEQYFVLEPLDEAYLNAPEEKILAKDGEVFFVIEEGRAVGTCAMIQHKPGIFELAKMGVAPDAQGRGYGKRLLEAALAFAKEKQAETVFLVSSRKLPTALRLYERYGFVHTAEVPITLEYDRSDVRMVWQDKNPPAS